MLTPLKGDTPKDHSVLVIAHPDTSTQYSYAHLAWGATTDCSNQPARFEYVGGENPSCVPALVLEDHAHLTVPN